MVRLYTKSGLLIATDFTRIVNGYYEIRPDKIVSTSIYSIGNWSQPNIAPYYWEYRTKKDSIKIYFQQRTVGYADYKIGYYYVSEKDARIDRDRMEKD